jgi:hypothetical protein
MPTVEIPDIHRSILRARYNVSIREKGDRGIATTAFELAVSLIMGVT